MHGLFRHWEHFMHFMWWVSIWYRYPVARILQLLFFCTNDILFYFIFFFFKIIEFLTKINHLHKHKILTKNCNSLSTHKFGLLVDLVFYYKTTTAAFFTAFKCIFLLLNSITGRPQQREILMQFLLSYSGYLNILFECIIAINDNY